MDDQVCKFSRDENYKKESNENARINKKSKKNDECL